MARTPVIAQAPAAPSLTDIERAQAKLVEAGDRQRHEEQQAERRSMGLPILPFPPDIERRRIREGLPDLLVAPDDFADLPDGEDWSDVETPEVTQVTGDQKKSKNASARRKAPVKASDEAEDAFAALEALSTNETDD